MDIKTLRQTDPEAFENVISGMMGFTGYPRWMILVTLAIEGVL